MRRRTPWLVAAAVALVLAVGGVGVALSLNIFFPRPDANGCTVRGETSCSDIPLGALEEAFEVDLPAGTTVLESSYRKFQDWQLEATFALPEGAIELGPEWSSEEADDEGVNHRFEYTEKDGATILTLTEFTT